MTTRSAAVAHSLRSDLGISVCSISELHAAGLTRSAIYAQVAANRWQRSGLAIVLTNTEMTPTQRRQSALINCGPRSVLAAFTAASELGLTNWDRDAIHLLVPLGTGHPSPAIQPIRLHRTGRPIGPQSINARRCQRMAPALILAASTFAHPRAACGLLAAGVQQRLTRADDLLVALAAATRVRHRGILTAAVHDIAMGAQALSEIDFVSLCRRAGLPAPVQQAVRADRSGQRRYLDALWKLAGGRELVVEVDGALHLAAPRWWADQLRQNELVLGGRVVLRFPSIVVRTESSLVVEQLRRGLLL